MAVTINQKRLYMGQPGTSASTLYTAPANTANNPSPNATAIVKEIWLINTTGGSATVTLGINGTAAANQIVPAVSVNGNDVKVLGGLTLELNANDTIQGLQATSGAITVIINGVEVQ